MAVINPTVLQPTKGVLIIKWAALANGDTGLPFALPQHNDKSVQIYGTFGTGGSVRLEGSDEAPKTVENPTPVTPTWATLNNPADAPLTFTAAGLEAVLENSSQIRPNVTAGDGTTALTVIVTAKAARS